MLYLRNRLYYWKNWIHFILGFVSGLLLNTVFIPLALICMFFSYEVTEWNYRHDTLLFDLGVFILGLGSGMLVMELGSYLCWL